MKFPPDHISNGATIEIAIWSIILFYCVKWNCKLQQTERERFVKVVHDYLKVLLLICKRIPACEFWQWLKMNFKFETHT